MPFPWIGSKLTEWWNYVTKVHSPSNWYPLIHSYNALMKHSFLIIKIRMDDHLVNDEHSPFSIHHILVQISRQFCIYTLSYWLSLFYFDSCERSFRRYEVGFLLIFWNGNIYILIEGLKQSEIENKTISLNISLQNTF